MISMKDKSEIIRLRNYEDLSERGISRRLGFSRITVHRILGEYTKALKEQEGDKSRMEAYILTLPVYKTENRSKRRFTEDIIRTIDHCLEENERKKRSGRHKQQVLSIEETKEEYQPKGWALVFHSDFIHGTFLGHQMKNYSFFSYESNEALHISEQERATVMDCLLKIEKELNHAIDKHTRTLITTNIQLLLNYCLRCYERQGYRSFLTDFN